MSIWRRTAIEKFPQIHRAIADAPTLCGVWYEIQKALESACRQMPLDENFVAGVYEFASWSLHHRSAHVRDCVIVCFYEDLLDHDTIRSDMARWVSQEDFNLFAAACACVYSGEKMKSIQQEFAARKAQLEGIASRRQRRLANWI